MMSILPEHYFHLAGKALESPTLQSSWSLFHGTSDKPISQEQCPTYAPGLEPRARDAAVNERHDASVQKHIFQT